MKAIATINFKGGVGKTTLTWLLARHAADKDAKRVLVVDSDAQMSLTLALGIDEARGTFVSGFGDWYENQHKKRNRTLLDALDRYDQYASGKASHFDFPVDGGFIYEVHRNLHFVPSTPDLYWLELEIFNPEHAKGFVKALLGKIEHSTHRPDIVFFDCPPSFTALSYSILSNCSLILIPTNPDVFAATGLRIMLDGLKGRIQPWPNPRIAVFMNKADWRGGRLTRESQTFLNLVEETAAEFQRQGTDIRPLKTFVPQRAAIRKSISFGGFPEEFRQFVAKLWDEARCLLSL